MSFDDKVLPGPGFLAQLACILEASAPKAGNVHPGRAFRDLAYVDFVLSAAAIAPALERAPHRPIGETILDAVRATAAVVGTNTNLGIILLLAPLCALPRPALAAITSPAGRRDFDAALERVLGGLTRRDAELAYEAIRLAAPGGLGGAERGDVRSAPEGTLREMMELARERDQIALQYSNGYREAAGDGLLALRSSLESGRSVEEAVVLCHLTLLSRHGDSLILRKRGRDESMEAARRAADVLRAGWPADSASSSFESLDQWLRAEGHERNPGACADLTAAALFLALASGIIRLPIHFELGSHG